MHLNKFLNGIEKERDPFFSKLEEKVFSQLKELTKDDVFVKIEQNKFVSFEEAIKELLEMRKKN
jgi:hypothetical protein